MAETQAPVTLFDRSAGKWVDMAPNDITSAVASGTHALPSGMTIPSVSPEGTIYDLPSDKAEEAFRDHGFRWLTPADQEASSARQMEASKEENFGDAQFAFEHGVGNALSLGTLGVAENALGLSDAANEVNRRSPIASAAGNLVGTLANPLIGAAGAAARGVGEAAGTALTEASGLGKVGEALSTAGEALQPTQNFGAMAESAATAAPSLTSQALTTAGKIVQNTAPNILGSAVEGSFYGLGQGVSEAALGDPKQVSENLLGNIENGFLFGGLAGGSIGTLSDSAPLIKSIVDAGTNKISDLVNAAAQKVAKGALVPALKMTGKGEAADLVSQLIPDAATRAALAEHGDDLKTVQTLAAEAEKDAAARVKDLDGSVRNFLNQFPAEESADLRRIIAESGNDLNGAVSQASAELDKLQTTYKTQLENMDDRPQVMNGLVERAQAAMKQLTDLGDNKSKTLANNIQAVLQSEVPGDVLAMKSIEREGFLNGTSKISDEVRLAQRLQDALPTGNSAIAALPRETQNAVEAFSSKINKLALEGNPNEFVSGMEKQIAAKSDALNQLTDFVGKDSKGLTKILSNPYMSDKLNTIMDNLGDFSADFDAISGKLKDVQGRQTVLDMAAQKANQLRQDAPGGKFTPADMQELLGLIGGPQGIGDKAGELSKISDELAGIQDLSPVDKYLRIQKALGRDISPNIAELRDLEPAQEAMSRLKDVSSPMKIGLGKLGALGAVGYVSPVAAGALSAVQGVSGVINNPYRTLQTLTTIEKLSNMGARKLASATDAAVNALTTPGARMAAVAAGSTFYNTGRALDEREGEFKQQRAFLKQLQDPENASNYIQNRLGSWHGAPSTQAQVGAQMIKTAQFLLSKMPQDPLAGKSLSGINTGWTPSDYELSKFNRYVIAAQDPGHVIKNISSGIATPEEIETLKTLYPATFGKLQTQVLDGITKNGDELSYQQRLTIGTLFGVPADATLQPDFVNKMQQNHTKANQPQGGRPGGKSIKIDIDPNNTFATETTRITNK